MYHRHPPPPSGLSATSQQSRFHAPATATTDQAIDVRDITLTVGTQTLIDGADLRLHPAGRYGLIGRNGAGKSLLLQCVAHRWLPGVPDDLPIFYVDQMEDWGATGGAATDTVLATVLGADAAAAARERDVAALEAGLAGGPAAAAAAAVAHRRRRAADAVADAQRRVDRTSGARGFAARAALKAAERALAAADDSPPAGGDGDGDGDGGGADGEAAVAAELAAELAALYEASEPPAERRGRAEAILAGMGFSPAAVAGPVGTLSGGWRIRVALACARFVDARVLLLDEPTNHLDLPGILDLKAFLNAECGGVTLLVVSHDRAFLDDTVDEIILLQARGLTYYDGNYSTYEQTVAEQVAARARQRDALDRKVEKARASIAADRARTTLANDPKSKKHRAIAAKERKLAERTGVEVGTTGHRFKLNRDRAGYHFSARGEVAAEHVEPDVVVRLPPPPPLRGRGPLLQAEGLSFAYRPTGRPLLDGVTLCVEPRDRVAFWGANGQGKTTLLKLLAGSLAPRSGRLSTRAGVRVALLEQHTVDDARQCDTPALTALLEAVPGLDERAAYAALGGVGVHGATARQPLSSLSGGQVMRWALARHAVVAPPHVLLLDEPTNHLDIETGAALLDALRGYEGAVVVVAHDVHFLRELGNASYRVAKGRVTRAAVP